MNCMPTARSCRGSASVRTAELSPIAGSDAGVYTHGHREMHECKSAHAMLLGCTRNVNHLLSGRYSQRRSLTGGRKANHRDLCAIASKTDSCPSKAGGGMYEMPPESSEHAMNSLYSDVDASIFTSRALPACSCCMAFCLRHMPVWRSHAMMATNVRKRRSTDPAAHRQRMP